jgi:endoglucanase
MRMTAVALPALFLGACGQAPEPALDSDLWAGYRARYVSPSGRVIDNGQGGISHSEGQAYALLLAQAADDRPGFDRIWGWTRDRLQVRDDALLAWKWDPVDRTVADLNNASDADVLAAWALMRAAARWDEEAYRATAERILADIKRKLVVSTPAGPALLPGADGFVHDGVVTVNLSYWVFPALSEFHRLDPDGPWSDLRAGGLALLGKARFGDHGLPADWLTAAVPPSPSKLFPARFGYESIRIPLYACWDGTEDARGMAAIAEFWSSEPHPPAWISLAAADRSTYGLGPGAMAVRRLLLDRLNIHSSETAGSVGPGDAKDYYDATLLLLAAVAEHESGT